MNRIQSYHRPQRVEDVMHLLSTCAQPRLLAGGTDLMLELHQKKEPVDIIDLGEVIEFKRIEESEQRIHVGCMVTFAQLQQAASIQDHARFLAQAAGQVGSPQIRNQGTAVGNLVNASPAADSIPALVALDAMVHIMGPEGERQQPITEVLQGINKTCLQPGELVTQLSFPKIKGLQSAFAKLGRRNALAISRISCAVGLVFTEGKVTQARVALGSVAPNPFRSDRIEQVLLGRKGDQIVQPEVLDAAYEEVAQKLGSRASAPYKREAIKGVLRQALEDSSAQHRV